LAGLLARLPPRLPGLTTRLTRLLAGLAARLARLLARGLAELLRGLGRVVLSRRELSDGLAGHLLGPLAGVELVCALLDALRGLGHVLRLRGHARLLGRHLPERVALGKRLHLGG
jgi:hypothetical protein